MSNIDKDGLELRNGDMYCHCRFCKNFSEMDGDRLPPNWKFIRKLKLVGGYCYFVCENCYNPQRDFITL